MNENLNLVEILKYCPKGTKLYSTVYGYVTLVEVQNSGRFPIKYMKRDGIYNSVTAQGLFSLECEGECVLFPSKDQRDWSKFTAPWYKKESDDDITDAIPRYELKNIDGDKLSISSTLNYILRNWTIEDAKDGDVLVCDINKAEIGGDVEKLPNIVSTIFIFKKLINSRDYIHSYCHLYDKHFLGLQSTMYYNSFVYNIRPAAKEQRDTLMKAMNDAGYEWDAKEKELRRIK